MAKKSKGCTTDTDCMKKYGGDGGPEPANARIWNEAASRHKAYADKLNSEAQADDDHSMDAFESQKEYRAYRKKKEAKRTKDALESSKRRPKEDLGYN